MGFMDYEIFMFEEESNDMTLKRLMLAYDKKDIYTIMNISAKKGCEEWTEYDCQIIADKLKSYKVNTELQTIKKRYRLSTKDAIIKLIDDGIIKMY